MPKVTSQATKTTRKRLGLFGVPRPTLIEYKFPKLRAWDYKNETWVTDLREIGTMKQTVLSFWTGKVDWVGKPIYVNDVVNMPYNANDQIHDAIYMVVHVTDLNDTHLCDFGGRAFVLHNDHGLIDNWRGENVEVIGDCFSMPDSPAVHHFNKLITKHKLKDGGVI